MHKRLYLLNSNLGRFSSPAMTVTAIIVSTILLFALYQNINQNIIAAIIILMITTFLIFATNGIYISNDKSRYKAYISYFGIKIGKWKSLEEYTDLAILRTTVSHRAYSKSNTSAETSRNTFFQICLLTPNHRKKLIIARFKLKEEALNKAPEIATKIGVNYTQFNPTTSFSHTSKK